VKVCDDHTAPRLIEDKDVPLTVFSGIDVEAYRQLL